MTTVVTESNEVKIPLEIAQRFRIGPGTQLEWSTANDGSISVKPIFSRGESARQFMGAGKAWLKPGVDPVEDLLRERHADDGADRQSEAS